MEVVHQSDLTILRDKAVVHQSDKVILQGQVAEVQGQVAEVPDHHKAAVEQEAADDET